MQPPPPCSHHHATTIMQPPLPCSHHHHAATTTMQPPPPCSHHRTITTMQPPPPYNNRHSSFKMDTLTGLITVGKCRQPGVSPCLDYETTKESPRLLVWAADILGEGKTGWCLLCIMEGLVWYGASCVVLGILCSVGYLV